MSSENDQLLQREQKGRLDKFQLFIVLLIQIAEPLTATVIFPFVNQFVKDSGITGGDERKTGYYAGYIESLFFVTECLTVYQWGRASDQVGRKPILMAGLVGMIIATTGVGLSKSFWMMLICRGAQGVFNGNIGVTKSVMVEISDPTTIGYAFSFVSIMWSTGSTVGPFLGGVLARPAERWPLIFGKMPFFYAFPYFLPCAAAAAVVAICATISSVLLKETLPAIVEKKRKKDYERQAANNGNREDPGCPNYDTLAPLDDGSIVPRASPSFKSLLTHRTLIPIINLGFHAFVQQSLSVIVPLMFSTSIPGGGLGMDEFEIGVVMSIWGVLKGFIQLFGFIHVVRFLGPRRTFVVGFGCQIILLAMLPLMSYTAHLEGRLTGAVYAILAVFLIINPLTSMAYASIHMIIVDTATNDNLGSTNGLAQMIASIMRSLAPSLTSSLFSASLESRIMGGTMVYWTLVSITILGVYTSTHLPKKMYRS